MFTKRHILVFFQKNRKTPNSSQKSWPNKCTFVIGELRQINETGSHNPLVFLSFRLHKRISLFNSLTLKLLISMKLLQIEKNPEHIP